MKYLLDTNIIIALVMDDDAGVVRRAGACDEGDIVTSTIALTEVAYGSSQGFPLALEQLRAFMEEVPVLDFDYQAALAYAALPFKRSGFDRLIAAHALSLGLVIVTRNVGDFIDVPGLVVENWSLA